MLLGLFKGAAGSSKACATFEELRRGVTAFLESEQHRVK